jgi:hypothetical protein
MRLDARSIQAVDRAIRVAEDSARENQFLGYDDAWPAADAARDAEAAADAAWDAEAAARDARDAAAARAAEAAAGAARAARAARDAAWAAGDAPWDAARAAEAAAWVAGDAVGGAAGAAAQSDISKLSSLKLGDFPELGDPVDPSESGPLGPLWPGGIPELLKSIRDEEETSKRVEAPPSEAEPERLVLEAEVSEFADTEQVAGALADLCYALNAYHIAAAGNGLVIDDWHILVPKPTPVGTR